MEMIIARMGPRTLPCCAREMPRPKAIRRTVPWKKESPTPDRGPISEVLTALMVSGLKFSRSAAYCSSMEAARPSVKALVCGVQL